MHYYMMCAMAVYMEIQQLTSTGTKGIFRTPAFNYVVGTSTANISKSYHACRNAQGLFLIKAQVETATNLDLNGTGKSSISPMVHDGLVKPPTKDTELGLKYCELKIPIHFAVHVLIAFDSNSLGRTPLSLQSYQLSTFKYSFFKRQFHLEETKQNGTLGL